MTHSNVELNPPTGVNGIPVRILNPWTPMSDQDRISPCSINTISTRSVMRMKKNFNLGIISWFDAKFSEPHENGMVDSKEK